MLIMLIFLGCFLHASYSKSYIYAVICLLLNKSLPYTQCASPLRNFFRFLRLQIMSTEIFYKGSDHVLSTVG
jgi:hypothetical protein